MASGPTPYPVIFRLGKSTGRLAQMLMKRRARIAYRNLELCFPDMSEAERHDMVTGILSLSAWG